MDTDPKTIAFIFPGQGSQSVGMGQELAQAYPIAQQIFNEADEILGFHLSRLAWGGPENELNDTINTQPALFVHSIAALAVFEQLFPDIQPAYTAGHSMGELSAMVASEALPFVEALKLVRIRGELMKEAGHYSPGGMAAVIGLDMPQLEQICSESSTTDEIVQVANDNCPGQVVISGAIPALERAMEQAQATGARRVVRLPISIAAHSPLMIRAQTAFNAAVAQTPIVDPTVPLIGNVTAEPLVTAAEIRADLQAQLNSRVRWTETIQYLYTRGIRNYFEIGNNTVLSGLIKRIDRQAQCYSIGTPADFEKLKIL